MLRRTPSPLWQVWPYLSPDQQREVAPLLAAAQWHCQQWDAMRRIVGLIEPKSYDGGFFRGTPPCGHVLMWSCAHALTCSSRAHGHSSSVTVGFASG